MRFSEIELKELAKAWFIISLAFAVVLSGTRFGNIQNIFRMQFLIPFSVAGLTVGIAFIFHELAHKFLAQKYKCFAEFRANNKMLLLALVISFFGFVFAAPGGVIVRGQVSRNQFGKISVAGIITNLALGAIFLALMLLNLNIGVLTQIFSFGAFINIWLATFNLLPVMPFDGLNVMLWSKRNYFVLVGVCVALLFTVSILTI